MNLHTTFFHKLYRLCYFKFFWLKTLKIFEYSDFCSFFNSIKMGELCLHQNCSKTESVVVSLGQSFETGLLFCCVSAGYCHLKVHLILFTSSLADLHGKNIFFLLCIYNTTSLPTICKNKALAWTSQSFRGSPLSVLKTKSYFKKMFGKSFQ